MKRKPLAIILTVLAAAILTAGALAITRKKARKRKMNPDTELTTKLKPGEALVEINTSEGPVTVLLFADTPAHRDNFLKLVKEGYYDGVLFHRVINQFMIQTGDPDSKNAPAGKHLGSGGPDYTLPAEIHFPAHFHCRGALAAARQGDQVNPERRSSGSQFYIVTGKTFADSAMTQMERQMQMMRTREIFDSLARENRDKIMELRRNRDQAGLSALQDTIIAQAERQAALAPATYTAEQRQAYATQGGSPHLDGQYTVFGQVVSGMDIVDKIEKAETDRNDRPVTDIRILSARVLKQN